MFAGTGSCGGQVLRCGGEVSGHVAMSTSNIELAVLHICQRLDFQGVKG